MTRSLARLRSTVVAGLFVLAGPAQAGTLSVIGVAPGDTLRLRAGPSPDTDEVGRIPPDADGLEPGEPTSN
ncbi:MAG: SH3 domain-containing protein, partial [Alphaproteobacteria bacterium]